MLKLLGVLCAAFLLSACSSVIQEHQQFYRNHGQSIAKTTTPYRGQQVLLRSKYPVPATAKHEAKAPSLVPPGSKVAAYRKWKAEGHGLDTDNGKLTP